MQYEIRNILVPEKIAFEPRLTVSKSFCQNLFEAVQLPAMPLTD